MGGECLGEATHGEATQACEALGARLCTAKELRRNCAQGTGCGFDREIVWSSTEADPPSNSGSKSKKSKSSKSKSKSLCGTSGSKSKKSKKSKSSKSKSFKLVW